MKQSIRSPLQALHFALVPCLSLVASCSTSPTSTTLCHCSIFLISLPAPILVCTTYLVSDVHTNFTRTSLQNKQEAVIVRDNTLQSLLFHAFDLTFNHEDRDLHSTFLVYSDHFDTNIGHSSIILPDFFQRSASLTTHTKCVRSRS